MLRGLPPLDLVTRQVFSWTGTVPDYTVPPAVEGRGPIHAETISGNGSGCVLTGADYGLPGVDTLTVEWWMNETVEYGSGHGNRYIISTRTGSNNGFSAGIGGGASGPPGNATRPQFVIQNVAVYTPSTYDIVARKWVHVAATLLGTSLRLYVDGSLVYTTTTASMTVGAALSIMGQGPSGFNIWRYDAHSIVVRNVPLTDDEVALRADPTATWDLYYELGRRTYFIPAAAGGAEGSGSVTGIGALAGVGHHAPEGAGDTIGIGALAGEGYHIASGDGDVTGVGAIVGEGEAPVAEAEGGGTVAGIGALVGDGEIVASGAGSAAGVGVIAGDGYTEHSGSGDTTGVGAIGGAGSAVAGDADKSGRAQPPINDPRHPYWQRRIEDADEADEPAQTPPKQPERRPLPTKPEPPERPRQPRISEALAAVSSDIRPVTAARELPEVVDATAEFRARELRLIEEILLLELAA